jgi:hypothetical protein
MTQTQNKHDADDVPVTGAFLSLVHILQASRTRFISETSLATDLGLVEPKDWLERCRDLFFNEFGEQAKMVGVSLNEITFSSLMDLKLDPELLRTAFDDLPLMFTFNPWQHQGKGGIKRVELEAASEQIQQCEQPQG